MSDKIKMHIKLLPLLSAVIYFNYYSLAQSHDTVKVPAADYLKSILSDSLLQNHSSSDVCQVTADFNSDGIKDIAVTGYYSIGSKVSNWALYLCLGDESFRFFSMLEFNNYAIQIDSVAKGISRIYVYDKTGEGVGDIIEYFLSPIKGIEEINKKTIHPRSFPDNEDFKYYKSIFAQSGLPESCKNISEYLK